MVNSCLINCNGRMQLNMHVFFLFSQHHLGRKRKPSFRSNRHFESFHFCFKNCYNQVLYFYYLYFSFSYFVIYFSNLYSRRVKQRQNIRNQESICTRQRGVTTLSSNVCLLIQCNTNFISCETWFYQQINCRTKRKSRIHSRGNRRKI